MVLAAKGTTLTEGKLRQSARMEEGGIDIEELARLAQTLGLHTVVQRAPAGQIRELLRTDNHVIAYINRSVFDLTTLDDLSPALRRLQVHAVVPVHVTASHVAFHDPRLPAAARKTVQRFEAAQRHMGSACLVFLASVT